MHTNQSRLLLYDIKLIIMDLIDTQTEIKLDNINNALQCLLSVQENINFLREDLETEIKNVKSS